MKTVDGVYVLTSFSEIRAFLGFLQDQAGTASDADGGVGLSDRMRLVVGLHAIGQTDLGGLGAFVANRYFLDSCLVDALPPHDSMQSWLEANQSRLNAELSRPRRFAGCGRATPFDTVQQLLAQWREESGAAGLSDTYGDSCRERLRRDGYCVIPSVLSEATCQELRALIFDLAARERAGGTAYVYGEGGTFQRIYNVIAKGRAFGEALGHPLVHAVMNDMFDRDTLHQKYTLSSFHANIIPGGGAMQKLHVDCNVPEPLPAWIVRANVNFILEDYTEQNGATLVVPGSHLWLRKPGPGDDRRVADQIRPVEAKAGSLAIWHGHVWHKSGHNRSSHDRVALLACFSASFMLEMALEENHFRIMSEDVAKALPGDLYDIIGWRHGIKMGALAGG